MTTITIISKDGITINLDMFSFADGLNFVRDFNKCSFDKVSKVWNVGYKASEIREEIEYQLAYNQIFDIMQRGNEAYGNQIAFSSYDNRAAMGNSDVEYWTKQLLQNPDTIHEIELDIFSAMENHIYNYRQNTSPFI